MAPRFRDGPQHPPDVPGEQPAGNRKQRQDLGWYAMMGMGLEFVIGVAALGALGWYLDRRWKTSPWLMLAGLVVAFVGGVWTMVKTALRGFKD